MRPRQVAQKLLVSGSTDHCEKASVVLGVVATSSQREPERGSPSLWTSGSLNRKLRARSVIDSFEARHKLVGQHGEEVRVGLGNAFDCWPDCVQAGGATKEPPQPHSDP